jgi:site-specific recombinase XerD
VLHRYTFATEALANGVSLAQVAELMEHTSTEMVWSVSGHLADRLSYVRDAARKAVT